MVKQETIEAIHARFKANSPNEVWLDVRRPDEWAEGVIPGVKKIQLSGLEDALPELDPDKTYILICRSGNRSNRAGELMESKGFKDLVNFEGGMMKWYQANYALAH